MIKIDLKNMYEKQLGEGIRQSDISLISEVFEEARSKFFEERDNIGFTKLPYNFDALKFELEKADKLMSGKNTVVVIGIGGSDLGARALHSAISHRYFNSINEKKLYFTGDTTDPEAISDLVDVLDFEKTLFLVISKSGNTIEQASTFVYFRQVVIDRLGEDAELNHFVFLTDPSTGTLQDLAKKQGYETISIPSDVGGRFSVLSTVGMVPAYLIGLNVSEFLKGARELDEQLKNLDYEDDFIMQYVAVCYMYYRNNKNISVMMPYQYSLYEFAKWYQQLWAESLGKKYSFKHDIVQHGITPVAAVGPTDQHSQLQLYNEGPNDKVITFIIAQDSRKDLNLPSNYTNVEPFEFLKGRTFHELLHYAHETTAFALTKNKRPNCTISIPQINEYYLGQLFYFFEVAVTYMGFILGIDPFDQPGVELSKNAMYGILGKSGYEKEKEDFENYQK